MMFIRAKRVFFFLVFAHLLPAAAAYSAEPSKDRPAGGAKISSDRVAMQLGLDPKVVSESMAEIAKAGYRDEPAIFFLVVAQHRTVEDLKNGKIEKKDFNETFKERIGIFLEKAANNNEWRFDVAQENNLIVSDVTRRARAIMRAARMTDAPPRQRNPRAATSPYPSSDISEFMVKRFKLPEDVLKRGWADLKGVNLKQGTTLFVLANMRSKRLIDLGAVAEAERAKAFVESVKFYHNQFHGGGQWGSLGMQENVHVYQLNHEADIILGIGARAAVARKGAPQKQEK